MSDIAIGNKTVIHLWVAYQAVNTTHQVPKSYRPFISSQNDCTIASQPVLVGHFMILQVTRRHSFEKIINNLKTKSRAEFISGSH
jgi:hypothetical protein